MAMEPVLVPILQQGLWQKPHVPEDMPQELQGHLSQEDYQQVPVPRASDP